jgi:hypothetical protein
MIFRRLGDRLSIVTHIFAQTAQYSHRRPPVVSFELHTYYCISTMGGGGELPNIPGGAAMKNDDRSQYLRALVDMGRCVLI